MIFIFITEKSRNEEKYIIYIDSFIDVYHKLQSTSLISRFKWNFVENGQSCF